MDEFSSSATRLFEEHKKDDLSTDSLDSTSETAWTKFTRRRVFGIKVLSNSVPATSNMNRRSPSSSPPHLDSYAASTFRVIEQPPPPSKNNRSMSMFELSGDYETDSPIQSYSPKYEYAEPDEFASASRLPRQRSASLFGSTTNPLRRCTSLQVNHTLGRSNNDENNWRLNIPNATDKADESTDKLERDRKKIRARRHSIQGSIEPLSQRLPSIVRAPKIQPSNLDSGLSWLATNPKQEQSVEFEFLDASEISTPDRSLSSRKRGPCGTQIEADMSLSLRSSARSLVLIPEDSQNFPTLPNINLHQSARNMEVESEDDDDDSVNDSRDTSFNSAVLHSEIEKVEEVEEIIESSCEPDQILNNMTTFEDLKYLLKTLQNQSKVQIFGSNSWTVTPRSAWPKSRSVEFIKWARAQFGFVSHSIDGSSFYLQIQKTHGRQLMQRVEAAVRLYETREYTSLQKPPCNDDQMKESPLFSRSAEKRKPLFLRSSLPTPMALSSTAAPTLHCDETDELVSGLNHLSVQDPKLVRTVTIEPHDQLRLEKTRKSIDAHVPSNDFIHSLHGCVHNEHSLARPPRPSFGHDSCSVLKPERLSVATSQDFGNAESFGTPMNQDALWGSRPVPGRDWGCSETCNDNIIARLTQIFEQRERELNRDSTTSTLPTTSRSSNLAVDLVACADDEILEVVAEDLHHDNNNGCIVDERNSRRRRASVVKSARMSLFLKTNEQESRRLSSHRPAFWSKRSTGTGIVENDLRTLGHARFPEEFLSESHTEDLFENHVALVNIFSFLSQNDLMTTASNVCTSWSDAATSAIVNLMRNSLDYLDDEDEFDENPRIDMPPSSLERSWDYLTNLFPWGRFLSYGAFKNVYKVHNAMTNHTEAVSVMDVNKIIDKQTILAELSVSAMLSSLARRAICPNFITLRGVFSCPHPPAPTHWGTMTRKAPLGDAFVPGKTYKPPRKPKESHTGRYVYIRMELCNEGDAEDFLKRQSGEIVDVKVAQAITFQTAFALYAAADKFSVKHYDMKLLNIFLHSPETKRNLVLRYGLGSHTFAVNMPAEHAYIAKIADYGTANIRPESNGQPVTIAQFTTLENTPPDFMILGDMAKQGHAHDCFGLGLCMLHLFTGHAPYEEILEKVKCPPGFKKRLRSIWENENEKGYDIIRSVILTDVYKDDAGNVIDGEPDETLYDTLYRFLVLFGIPDVQFEIKRCPKVWKAIHESFSPQPSQRSGKSARGNQSDVNIYRRHCKSFSILQGNNEYIARARKGLMTMEGGMELLFKLCSFDPSTRATALEVLNSSFMANLAEKEGSSYHPDDTVHSFSSFSTHR